MPNKCDPYWTDLRIFWKCQILSSWYSNRWEKLAKFEILPICLKLVRNLDLELSYRSGIITSGFGSKKYPFFEFLAPRATLPWIHWRTGFRLHPILTYFPSANRLKTLQGYFWHQCQTNVTHIGPIREYFENAKFCHHGNRWEKLAKFEILPICLKLVGNLDVELSYRSGIKTSGFGSKKYPFFEFLAPRATLPWIHWRTGFRLHPILIYFPSANRLKTLQGYFWHQCRTNVTHIGPIREYFENAKFCHHGNRWEKLARFEILPICLKLVGNLDLE